MSIIQYLLSDPSNLTKFVNTTTHEAKYTCLQKLLVTSFFLKATSFIINSLSKNKDWEKPRRGRRRRRWWGQPCWPCLQGRRKRWRIGRICRGEVAEGWRRGVQGLLELQWSWRDWRLNPCLATYKHEKKKWESNLRLECCGRSSCCYLYIRCKFDQWHVWNRETRVLRSDNSEFKCWINYFFKITNGGEIKYLCVVFLYFSFIFFISFMCRVEEICHLLLPSSCCFDEDIKDDLTCVTSIQSKLMQQYCK